LGSDNPLYHYPTGPWAPGFFTGLHRCARTTPGLAWQDWLENQRPTPAATDAHRSQPDQRDAERMNQLIDALHHIRGKADAGGLHLPRRLQAWGDWVIPVGRLSFPTGPAVTRLLTSAYTAVDRHQPHAATPAPRPSPPQP
jgi:hypothetical protein